MAGAENPIVDTQWPRLLVGGGGGRLLGLTVGLIVAPGSTAVLLSRVQQKQMNDSYGPKKTYHKSTFAFELRLKNSLKQFRDEETNIRVLVLKGALESLGP